MPALAFTLHIYAYFIFITCRFNFSASSAATAVDIAIGNSRLSSSDRCNPLLLFWPGYPINKLPKQRQSHADTLTRSTKQLQSVEYAANPPLDTSRYPDTHISRYPDTTGWVMRRHRELWRFAATSRVRLNAKCMNMNANCSVTISIPNWPGHKRLAADLPWIASWAWLVCNTI